VFQTAGEPPSSGSTIRANIGCTRNSSAALTRIADAYRATSDGDLPPTLAVRPVSALVGDGRTGGPGSGRALDTGEE
jgi:hypothetical protein